MITIFDACPAYVSDPTLGSRRTAHEMHAHMHARTAAPATLSPRQDRTANSQSTMSTRRGGRTPLDALACSTDGPGRWYNTPGQQTPRRRIVPYRTCVEVPPIQSCPIRPCAVYGASKHEASTQPSPAQPSARYALPSRPLHSALAPTLPKRLKT